MRRKALSLLVAASMVVGMTACNSAAPTTTTAAPTTEAPAQTEAENTEAADTEAAGTEAVAEANEVDTIHWARANSGNILVTIAQRNGYFEDAGLTVIEDPVDTSSAALTALQTEQVDVTSNQGTNGPLNFIGRGSDFTMVGGYMLKGMYIVGLKDTEWNGVESLKGSKFAYNGIHPVTGIALLDAGIDPETDLEWLSYDTNSARLTAVIKGEADYAVLSGDQLLTVGNTEEVEIKAWLDDLVPNYGCCRMNMNTEFITENPVATKNLLKALIRAEQWYNANKEECVKILAAELNADEEYVAAYLLNENYVSSVDPCKKAIIKTWEAMVAMGFIDEEAAEDINIEDHINTELYKAALDECIAEYYDEDPDFYDGRVAFFEENNQ